MRSGVEASSPCIEDLLACVHRGKTVDTTESQGKVLNLTVISYLKRQTGKDLAHAFASDCLQIAGDLGQSSFSEAELWRADLEDD